MSTSPPAPSTALPSEATAANAGVRNSWTLTRNCAISPCTFFWNVGALAGVVGAVGTGFWVAGYPLVMFFCACQLFALGIAGIVFARHATDGERVRVDAGTVRVETSRGCRQRVVDFQACWVRLERHPSGALTLRGGRAVVPVGEQLTPAARKIFAEEFAASIALARQHDASIPRSGTRACADS